MASGYLVLQGDVHFRTAQSKHFPKLPRAERSAASECRGSGARWRALNGGSRESGALSAHRCRPTHYHHRSTASAQGAQGHPRGARHARVTPLAYTRAPACDQHVPLPAIRMCRSFLPAPRQRNVTFIPEHGCEANLITVGRARWWQDGGGVSTSACQRTRLSIRMCDYVCASTEWPALG